MSVYAIAKQEVEAVNQPDPQRQPAATGGGAVGTAVLEPTPEVAPTASLGLTANTGIGTALSAIGIYIPTEVMATYLAILAAMPTDRGHGFQWLMFWVFLILTPIVVWLGVAVARQAQGIVVKPAEQWPWWSMIAATVAFAAFIVVLPGSVTHDISWYEPWMGTVAIILSAFVLGLGDQFFGTRRSSTKT